jgi:hypothetical protein
MANIPNTNTRGSFLSSVGNGTNASVWASSPVVLTLPYTYSVSGILAVPSGYINYLPPFFFPVPSGQTVTLVSVIGMVRSGSCTLSIDKNGAGITGLTGISFTNSPSTHTPTSTVTVSNNDYFAPVISAVSSADGLSLTFYFKIT